MGQVYEPEVEPNPDPPPRDDEAERIRVSHEMRRKLFELQTRHAFTRMIDQQVRKRYAPPWWLDGLFMFGEVSLRMWPVWAALALWLAFK